VALCSGLAPLINNHFGRRALFRGRLRLHAINATALIEMTVTTAALSEPGAWPVSWFVGRAFEYVVADELTATKIYEFFKGRRASGRAGLPGILPREPFRGTPVRLIECPGASSPLRAGTR
jgi:hypothetical protein